MPTFSRRLVRVDAVRTATALLALCAGLALAAYVFSAVYTTVTAGAVVAAVAALAIVGSGLLYAWRSGPGGLSD